MYWQSRFSKSRASPARRGIFSFSDGISREPHLMEQLMTDTKTVERQASAAAKKEERARDGVVAMREYEAEKARIDANTERLRALRLAREAADAVAAEPPAAVAAPRRSAKARPGRAGKASTSA